jgi:hypothetical protein
MTASTVKSTRITNISANPPTVADARTQGGMRLVERIAEIEVATTSIDEIGDVILLCEIPSDAVIVDVLVRSDDLDADATPTLEVDVGLYYFGDSEIQKKTGKTLGTVADADCLGDAKTSLQAANATWTSIVTSPSDVKDINKEAWEVAGLTTNPGGKLVVALTVDAVAATAAAGGLVARVQTLEV